MFLVDYFDITKYFEYDCAIVLQSRHDGKINYFWNGIYYFDIQKMKNTEMLNWNCSPGCDVGCMMSGWLCAQLSGCPAPDTNHIRWTDKEFHNCGIYFIKHLWSCTWNKTELPENINDINLINFLENDPRNVDGKYFCEIYDNVFLHYRAGGNWRGEGMNVHKKITHDLKQVYSVSI